jgi:aminomethyltransferase
MLRKTPLHALHVALGERMVDFGGWDMPVHYGSQIEEHHAVRRRAGLFDVSHMCVVDLRGTAVRAFLERLVANDVGKLQVPGKALYSCMLNEAGGVIDDLIVYFLDERWFRLVVNAGTRDKDLAWIRAQVAAQSLDIDVIERADLAMLAVQGPDARAAVVRELFAADAREGCLALGAFFGRESRLAGGEPCFVARTGYTGEDGFELMLPAAAAEAAWRRLNAAGVASCGLGARDTLRLEAGMNLYGNDMDEQHHPLESGLAWTVAFDPPARDFIGRAALEALRERGDSARFVGLVLEDRGVLRSHQRVVVPGVGEGETTSGSYAPTMERSIAFARVPRGVGERVQVDIRGKLMSARVVKMPFVRHGRVVAVLS